VIRRVKLLNFTCHKETEIELSEGLIVFLGRNGSGKSSVIDGITYALYGRHTRGDSVNIVRDGAEGGRVELELEYRGSRYLIVRSFDSKGCLESAALRRDGKLLVAGERRREEAVSRAIQEILGLSYDRMRTAVIVQQGELDRILSEDPRILKALFDDLMGFTEMEAAYDKMREVIEDFENRILKEVGRPIQDAERIDGEIKRLEEEVKSCERRREALEEEVRRLERELAEVGSRLEELKRAKRLVERIRLGLSNLVNLLTLKLRDLEGAVAEAEEWIKLLGLKGEVEGRISRIRELEELVKGLEREAAAHEAAISQIQNQVREVERELAGIRVDVARAKSLEELKNEARVRAERLRDDAIEFGRSLALSRGQDSLLRLQLDQEVEDVVESVVEAYNSALAAHVAALVKRRDRLLEEAAEARRMLESARKRLDQALREVEELSRLDGRDVSRLAGEIERAVEELERIGGVEAVERMKASIGDLKRRIGDLMKMLMGEAPLAESELRGLEDLLGGEEVVLLEEVRRGMAELEGVRLDEEEFRRLEEREKELIREVSDKRARLEELEREIGVGEAELRNLRAVRDRLLKAKEFRDLLNKIRSDLFHRDGAVLKSLRTWIFSRVADQARKYLDVFDVRIDDVKIEERGRSVVFKCFFRGREVDKDRLSGGEKVALALAIRLAIGDVLGAQRLGFFILDEPTIHLDSENRRRLLEVFASLSRAVRQVIIITHDEEVFEGAEARIIKFERGLAPNAPTIVRDVA